MDMLIERRDAGPHAADEAGAVTDKPAGSSWWDSAMDGMKSAGNAVDGAVHKAGAAIDHVAEQGITKATSVVRHYAGDTAARAVHGAAEAVHDAVKQQAGFTYGVAAGATGAVGGMVEGTGKLVEGAGTLAHDGYRLATNSSYRAPVGHAAMQEGGKLLDGAGRLAKHVAHDPLGSAREAAHGAESLGKSLGKSGVKAGEDWLRGVGRAVQEGHGGEYLGRQVGSAAVNVGSFFVPGAGEAEAANIAGHMGELANVAGHVGEAANVTARAAEVTNGAAHAAPFASDAARGASAAEHAAGGIGHANAAEHVAAAETPEALAGSVEHVNPTKSTQNCTNCAYSVDHQMATGAKSSALPRSEGVPFSKLNGMYKTTFSGWVSKSHIESEMLKSGEGTRAIIYGMDARGRAGHVWNAVVQHGKVN
jgi:hypothetical protein